MKIYVGTGRCGDDVPLIVGRFSIATEQTTISASVLLQNVVGRYRSEPMEISASVIVVNGSADVCLLIEEMKRFDLMSIFT